MSAIFGGNNKNKPIQLDPNARAYICKPTENVLKNIKIVLSSRYFDEVNTFLNISSPVPKLAYNKHMSLLLPLNYSIVEFVDIDSDMFTDNLQIDFLRNIDTMFSMD